MRLYLLAAAAALLPSIASAGPIGVTITSSNSGYYGGLGADGIVHTMATSGDNTHVSTSGGTGNNLYSVQFDQQTAITPDGGFIFQTSINAKGNVNAFNETKVTLSITNNGTTAEHLRLDSQILPGHIGSQQLLRNTNSANFAEYLFNVSLDGSKIYTNYGEESGGKPTITGFTSLNGSTPYTSSGEVVSAYAADWGATNINLDLGTFAAGQTKTLVYDQALYNQITSTCRQFVPGAPTLADCSGVSLAFGDPHHSGGVVGANIAGHGNPGSSPIDFNVNPYGSYFHVVDFSAPLPAAPPPPIVPNYNPPSQVPEPATLALLGLGALGIVGVRGRRG